MIQEISDDSGAQLLAYLNHEITLDVLVDWAERTFVDNALEPEAETGLLNDILLYLAAADTAQFPLTWDICAGFMDRLGMLVKVVPVVA